MGERLKFFTTDGHYVSFDPIDAAGTKAFTADQPMGDNKITNLGSPDSADEIRVVPASIANGDIFYWNGTLSRLAKGTGGHYLTVSSGGLPVWEA